MEEENVTQPEEVLTTQDTSDDWDNHIGDHIIF